VDQNKEIKKKDFFVDQNKETKKWFCNQFCGIGVPKDIHSTNKVFSKQLAEMVWACTIN
jgi:hypothetical protein